MTFQTITQRLQRWRLSALIAAIVITTLSGCVSNYALKQDAARDAVIQGKYQEALQVYTKGDKATDYVDVLLNRGLSKFETTDYLAAENDLRRAEERIEELYTKSISRGVLSMVSNDRALAYSGTNFERGMIHYYRGLGFLERNRRDDFIIEGRSLSKYLTQLPELSKKSDTDFAFLQYFSGIGYDLGNQPNDAWISYERARTLYPKQLGTTPPFLPAISAVAAKRAGIISSDSLRRSGFSIPDSSYGRLIVLLESGVCAGLDQEDITIPIFETDQHHYGDDYDYAAFGRECRRRSYHTDPHLQIVDWLHVAIPKLDINGKTRVNSVQFSASGLGSEQLPLAVDLSDAFERDFNDRLPAILGRAVARTIVKRVSANTAKDQGGTGFYWLVKLLGEATETADTRSWALLPDKIFVYDKYVPNGSYHLSISANEDIIPVDKIDISDVKVEAGKSTIKRIRIRG